MKTARRLISLALVLLMALALVACNGGGGTTTTNNGNVGGGTGGGETGFVLPDRPVDQMKDKTYIVIQHQAKEIPFKYAVDSLMGEKVAERILEVQELYGCTLEFDTVAYNTFSTDILARSMMTDGTAGDLVYSDNNAQVRKSLGTGGDTSIMLPILYYDHIINFWDFEKWGNITSRETMMAGGVFYGVTPALWIDNTPLPFYIIVYNKDMLETFGIKDPQEIWAEGKWDRDAMLEGIVKAYDDTGSVVIKGIAGNETHMARSAVLSTGLPTVILDKVNVDGTAEWTFALEHPDAIEALTWLKSTRKQYEKNFKIENSWNAHKLAIEGSVYMAVTRPLSLFGEVVVEMNNFGLMLWAGAEYNVQSGFYENCYSVCIPSFAQNPEHSAFLMYDLFEGMNGIESQADMVAYYRETYFDSDIDVELLYRDKANLQYSYWPNDLDVATYNQIGGAIMSASSIEGLIGKVVPGAVSIVETHLIKNQVVLQQYREAGYFD